MDFQDFLSIIDKKTEHMSSEDYLAFLQTLIYEIQMLIEAQEDSQE